MNNYSIGIIKKEHGILKKNGIFFHTPSDFAKKNLCYALWGATYTCIPPYTVQRASGFNALIFFYIEEGALDFNYRGKNFSASAGDTILLDCNYPHSYRAKNKVIFSWFHFNGNNGKAYAERLWTSKGAVFQIYSGSSIFRKQLSLLEQGSTNCDEIAMNIQQLFSYIAQLSLPNYSNPIQDAKSYIEQNFHQEITVDDIAAHVKLSRYYFSRLFRRESGLSPYAYLLQIRLDYAKKQLSKTNTSIEIIAENCVFYSASNFIRTFHKYVGMTPLKFRKLFHDTTL